MGDRFLCRPAWLTAAWAPGSGTWLCSDVSSRLSEAVGFPGPMPHAKADL